MLFQFLAERVVMLANKKGKAILGLAFDFDTLFDLTLAS